MVVQERQAVAAEGEGLPRDQAPRRRRFVLAVAVGAGLVSAGGLVGAHFVRSPAQAAADTSPPPPSVITASVVRQVLASTIVLRGTFGDGRTVTAQPTSVAAEQGQPSGAGASALVVTGVFVRAGDEVRAARPLIEYSGRPVFALPGQVPMYRDLVPGLSGKDVYQFQRSLVALGFASSGLVTGTFDAATGRAVQRLYRAMGYAVPVTAAVSGDTGAATASAPADAPVTERSSSGAQSAVVQEPMLPMSEVVLVPALPARVVSVPVAVGDTVKGPVITLARGGMQLQGRLDPSDADLVKHGMAVSVLSETTGMQVAAVVDSVGTLTAPGQKGQDTDAADGSATGGAYLPLSVHPKSGSWPTRFAGQNVRLTITAASTDTAVLAVPEAALSSGADTRTRLTVVAASGAQRIVIVRAGVSAGGLVAVVPLNGSLQPGDKVVVGQ
ncbi:peptidoglycan-binding protein [Streptomyces sp. NPDC005374]|uniref:peptidoglycan-binding protein n=1 Tax=Streptomyces sp. NPDC005374 TaxID=3364713 RepID=UPI00369A4FBA